MTRDVNSGAILEAVADGGYVTPREEEHFASRGTLRRGREASIRQNGHLEAHDPESLARMISNARKDRPGKKIGIRDRVCCYQWTWFTMVSR